MSTCVNFLENIKCITASLNVCPSPLKALLSGLFCLQLFSGTPLNRTGPPNHFLLNYLFLSSYLTSISFCFFGQMHLTIQTNTVYRLNKFIKRHHSDSTKFGLVISSKRQFFCRWLPQTNGAPPNEHLNKLIENGRFCTLNMK